MRSRKEHVLAATIVSALALVAYIPALGNGFLKYDDLEYVIDNPGITGPWRDTIKAAFSHPYLNNYAPLHIISYAIDYALFGLQPVAFHAVNLTLHAVNAVLVLFLVLRISKDLSLSTWAALFFAIHPVQVESVAWIAERKNVLSTALMLGSALAYFNFAASRRWHTYAASIALFGAALLTKSAVVVLPVLLCIYALLYESNRRRHLFLLVPFFVLAAAFSVTAILTQQRAMVAYHGGSLWATCLTMTTVVLDYLALLVLLKHPSPLYQPTIHTYPSVPVVAATLLLAALATTLWRARKNCHVVFWASWCFVPLIPVLQIIPIFTLMNDRYLYVPMLGVGALTALTARRALGSRAWMATAPLLALLLALTLARSSVWRETALWEDALRHYPTNADLYVHLALEHHWGGRVDPALEAIQRAIEINPRHREAWEEYGVLLLQARRYKEALRVLQLAYDLGSRNDLFVSNLGYAYIDSGDLQTGLRYQREALELNPGCVNAIYGTALALEKLGELDSAATYWRRFLDATPPDNPWRAGVRERLQRIEQQLQAGASAEAAEPSRYRGE